MHGKERFAVLQLSGCAGCEVSLLNAGGWSRDHDLVYMPLVVSEYDVPEVDTLLVSGGVRNEEDLYNLRRASKKAGETVAVGTCAISGGIVNLGDRDDVREIFLSHELRREVPRLLPRCRPIDAVVTVHRYLPGCPPTPELFNVLLDNPENYKIAKTVCQECGRRKKAELRPKHLSGFLQGEVDPGVCLINLGYLCIGSSTRGGCRALCTIPGHPCVGCRGPCDAFIDNESKEWLQSILRVFTRLTDVPPEEIDAALRSPQMALFLFQFADAAVKSRDPEYKKKVL